MVIFILCNLVRCFQLIICVDDMIMEAKRTREQKLSKRNKITFSFILLFQIETYNVYKNKNKKIDAYTYGKINNKPHNNNASKQDPLLE